MRILIDLDEVITDFVGGALKIHGWTKEQFEEKHPPGLWNINGTMNLSLAKFWAPIDQAGEDFWLNLEILPWAGELINLVQSVTKDWHIISSPSWCPSSYTGKVKWLKRYFGSDFDRFALTPHKEIFAGPEVILIDDREENLVKFMQHGGKTILFPTLNNSFYKQRHAPMTYVNRFFPKQFKENI